MTGFTAPRRRHGVLIVLLCTAAAVLAGPAAAQVSEADRLARCANNRAEIARLDADAAALRQRLDALWSDEKLARAKAFGRSLSADNVSPRQFGNADELKQLLADWAQTAEELGIPRCTADARGNLTEAYHLCAVRYSITLVHSIERAEGYAAEREALTREQRSLVEQTQRHRTNLSALGCDAPTPAPAPATSAADGSAAEWMTGTFSTSEGEMNLSPSGGTYNQDSGRIRVKSVDGPVMLGEWEEGSSGRRCADGRYYGRIRFQFTATGFTGAWGYCDDEPDRPWTGTRK